jgi:hypothetical protein
MLTVGLAVGTGHRFSARSIAARGATHSIMSSPADAVRDEPDLDHDLAGSQRQGDVLVTATIRELRTAIELARSSTTLAAGTAVDRVMTLASVGVWLCEERGVPAPHARRGLDGRRSPTETLVTPAERVVVD